MFHFEAEDIQLDMVEVLSNFGIPVAVYQRLEFVFRRVMMACPAIQAEYRTFEPEFDLSSIHHLDPSVEAIDVALDSWHARYPDQAYGLTRLASNVAEGRAKARSMYRKALASFSELSDADSLTDRWLSELESKLRFHIGRNEDVETSIADDLLFYMAAADVVYRPFFEMHFQNRRHTNEKLHQFVVMKFTLETGRSTDFSVLAQASVSLETAIRDIQRSVHLPSSWPEGLTLDSIRYDNAA